MNVIYRDKAGPAGEADALLRQASGLLAEVLGPSAALVKAEWGRTEDARHRPLYALRLSDWSGEVSAAFAPAELRSPRDLRYRLLRLWGDLLQARSHKQLTILTSGSVGPAGE